MIRLEYNPATQGYTAHQITAKESARLDNMLKRCQNINSEIENLKRQRTELNEEFQNLLDSTLMDNVTVSMLEGVDLRS